MAKDDSKVLARLLKHMKAREEDPLTPLIDEYFLLRGKAPQRYAGNVDLSPRPRPGGRLSPSSICGCERQAMFKFVGMPGRTRIDPDTEEIFDDGDWRHLKWQARFHDMEAVLGSDVFEVIGIEDHVTYPKLFIAGSLDAHIIINGDYECIIDFKGINSYGFRWLVDNNQPKEEHIFQLICYMRMKKVRTGILLYENKDNQQRRVCIIRFDKEKWGYVQRWCARVIREMEERELPDKHMDCTKGHFLWTRCAFADHCFGDRSAEQVRRQAYRNFPGVAEAHARGNTIVEEHNAR